MRFMGGWTYQDYLDQPPEIIDAIVVRMNKNFDRFGVSRIDYTVQLLPDADI